MYVKEWYSCGFIRHDKWKFICEWAELLLFLGVCTAVENNKVHTTWSRLEGTQVKQIEKQIFIILMYPNDAYAHYLTRCFNFSFEFCYFVFICIQCRLVAYACLDYSFCSFRLSQASLLCSFQFRFSPPSELLANKYNPEF